VTAPATLRLCPLPGNEPLAGRLAAALTDRAAPASLAPVTVRRFPDGESYVRLDADVRDADVAVALPVELPPDRRRTPVLVDDIISTGHTMAEAARLLVAAGYPPPARRRRARRLRAGGRGGAARGGGSARRDRRHDPTLDQRDHPRHAPRRRHLRARRGDVSSIA
jgi:hypothetical protein